MNLPPLPQSLKMNGNSNNQSYLNGNNNNHNINNYQQQSNSYIMYHNSPSSSTPPQHQQQGMIIYAPNNTPNSLPSTTNVYLPNNNYKNQSSHLTSSISTSPNISTVNNNNNIITDKKGLVNQQGQYNCFINVVIQILWHLKTFREIFLKLPDDLENHIHENPDSCVYCSLKNLFTHFQYSEENHLVSDILRKSLSITYYGKKKFQLSEMDDASEAFQAIIKEINDSLIKYRIPIFDYNFNEIYYCNYCKKYCSNPFKYTTTCCWISSSELMNNSLNLNFEKTFQLTSEQLINTITCNYCNNNNLELHKYLDKFPSIVTIAFAWDKDIVSENEINQFINFLKFKNIKLNEMFRLKNNLNLIGNITSMICYYGKHYICLVYDKDCWFIIDDHTIKKIDNIYQFIISSKLQPCVVFIEVLDNNEIILQKDLIPKQLNLLSSTNIVIDKDLFGFIIQGQSPIKDFFLLKPKLEENNDQQKLSFMCNIKLTKDQLMNIGNQLSFCIYLDKMELKDYEFITIKMLINPLDKNENNNWIEIGKLTNRNRSIFNSIPIGFFISSIHTSSTQKQQPVTQLTLYLRKNSDV
ncbi:hypothetical protein ABK040_012931 [Willaertia magna]